MALSLEVTDRLSTRKAAFWAVIFFYSQVEHGESGVDAADKVHLSFSLKKKPGAAWSLEGKAATIRQKLRGVRIQEGKFGPYCAEDAHWLACMVSAITMARTGKSREVARTTTVHLASWAGEGRFAEQVLVPMSDSRFLHPGQDLNSV